MTIVEIEEDTIYQIFKALYDLGGEANDKEIINVIRDNNVPYKGLIDEIRKSKKTGNTYCPYLFRYNFAIKYLMIAGYVERMSPKHYKLTQVGQQITPDKLNYRLIYQDGVAKITKHSSLNFNKKLAINSDMSEDNIDRIDQWRNDLLSALQKFTPAKFELFSRGLVKAMGVQLDSKIVMKLTNDDGLDGFGYMRSNDFRTTRVAIQAKKWKSKVSAPEIDKFRGAMDKQNAEFGIFITTSFFTDQAVKAARSGSSVITLIDGDEICDLVAKYQLHVKPVTTYELDNFYYDI